MSDLSKNGNGVPASATRFAHLGTGAYGMLPIAWAPHMRGLKAIVFWVLCAHVDAAGYCYPSRETIARLCGINGKNAANEVRKLLRELETMGAIATEHRDRRASRYRILPPPSLGEGDQPSLPTPGGGRFTLPPEGESPSLVEGESPSHNRPRNKVFNRTSSRARAKASEQAKADEQEAVLTDDEQACFANDLADAAFNATRGFTDEQRRANLARFKTMLTRRDARFGTTG